MKLKNFIQIFFILPGLLGKIVQINDGKIHSSTIVSWLSRSFDAFLNIPFAEPPVGELRFKPPQKAKPWKDIRNGTVYGPSCWQTTKSIGKLSRLKLQPDFSEDCLSLNVFTKNLPLSPDKISQPVIVYIHGGWWTAGSAKGFSPKYLIDRNLVIVSINYR